MIVRGPRNPKLGRLEVSLHWYFRKQLLQYYHLGVVLSISAGRTEGERKEQYTNKKSSLINQLPGCCQVFRKTLPYLLLQLFSQLLRFLRPVEQYLQQKTVARACLVFLPTLHPFYLYGTLQSKASL